MKSCSVMTCILWFVIGGLIGAGITYHSVKFETTGMNIKLDSSGQSPGISITKTGQGQ